jgi:ABC-type antimicrobial peptide transport system permease subunit
MITSSSLKNEIVINEAAVKAFGWHPKEAVGKYIVTGGRDTTHVRVIGIMKDFYNESPTLPVKPIGFGTPISVDYQISGINSVLIKYKEESWDKLRIKIDSLVQQNYPFEFSQLTDTEEEYDKFLTSEQALLKMLTALSIVCIIISVFGIYSQVVLTCEQRRKEIAIRKVNGAKLGDILSIFAKEYMSLVIIASIIAFPIGYALMKQWIEHYTRQTEISIWIFICIFIGITILVTLCIGYRVWKTANENPADVVKSE